MSGAVVVTPSTGAAWSTAWEQFEGIRKGLISLSLTNYDATTVPQIASGSWVECAGSIYKWTSNDTITGTPSANAINYITLVPSGTGASAILTPTWSDSAPTWSDAYQGYYSGTTRYAGGCYYDGTNYYCKWIYTNRHAGSFARYLNLPFTYHTDDNTNVTLDGLTSVAVDPSVADEAYMAVMFPPHSQCVVTEFRTYCSAYTDGTHTISLNHGGETGALTTMASNAHTGTGALTDTSITDPIIDTENEHYWVEIGPSAAGSATIHGVRIKFYMRL